MWGARGALGGAGNAPGWVRVGRAALPALTPPLPTPPPVFLFQVPPIEETFDDNKHSLKPWDTKKVGAEEGVPPASPCPATQRWLCLLPALEPPGPGWGAAGPRVTPPLCFHSSRLPRPGHAPAKSLGSSKSQGEGLEPGGGVAELLGRGVPATFPL